MDWFSQVFDVTLLATIGLVVAVSLVIAYIGSRRRDVCLTCFDRFQVTMLMDDGRAIWGTLLLDSSGLEIEYRTVVQDTQHIETSYVLYANEFAQIQAICRFADELSEHDIYRRERDLHRSFHPRLVVRLARGVQHFFALAGDSLTEALGALMGSLRKPAGRYISDTGEAELRKLGSTVIGSVGRSFDPLLERFIGHKVVAEIAEGDEVHEHVGIFKAYSAEFIVLLDVHYPEKHRVKVDVNGRSTARFVEVDATDRLVRVHNTARVPVLVDYLCGGEDAEDQLINVMIEAGGTNDIELSSPILDGELVIQIEREVDVIVPRTRCVIRHRAEGSDVQTLPEIIYDVGVLFRGESRADAREARLRRELIERPASVLAMVNLAAMLMQRQKYSEAEPLLLRATRMRLSLPDNGRRVQLMLLELKRRTARSPENRSRLLAASQPAASMAAQVDAVISSVNGSEAARYQATLGAPEVGGG